MKHYTRQNMGIENHSACLKLRNVSPSKYFSLFTSSSLSADKYRVWFQTEYKYCYDLVLHYVLHYLNQESTT